MSSCRTDVQKTDSKATPPTNVADHLQSSRLADNENKARLQCRSAENSLDYILSNTHNHPNAKTTQELQYSLEVVVEKFCYDRSSPADVSGRYPIGARAGYAAGARRYAPRPEPKPSTPADLDNAAKAVSSVTAIAEASLIPDFKSSVFACVRDYEVCKNYYVKQASMGDATFTCGFSFLVCLGQQLVPFAGK